MEQTTKEFVGLSAALLAVLAGYFVATNNPFASPPDQSKALSVVTLQGIIGAYGGSEKTGLPIDSLGTQIKYSAGEARFEFHTGLTDQPNATMVLKCNGNAMVTEFLPRSFGEDNPSSMADYPPCDDRKLTPGDNIVRLNPAFITSLGSAATPKP